MKDDKIRKNLLGRLVALLEAVSQYADALYCENQTTLYVKDRTGIEMHADADAGVKIRAYDGKTFHEVCVQGWQPEQLQREVQSLSKRLKEMPPQKGVALKLDRKSTDKSFATEPEKDHRKVSIEDKTAMMETLHDTITADKAFQTCQVTFQEAVQKRIFVSRYKRLSSEWTGCTIGVVPTVQSKNGEMRSQIFQRFGNGFEITALDDAELKSFLTRVKKLKQAKRIPPKAYTVILSPNVSGLLAHESFGHGMESDTILHDRARAEEYLGKRIASAKVTICDDPSLKDTHGMIFFDDEGMLPERVSLVERGMVRSPITDLYSASALGFRRSANGRIESFDRKVYARMTNTFFKRGGEEPSKIIKSVRNGMYIHQGSAGMEDPKGWGVQISGLLCERIKNGKLTGELFAEVTMGGFLPDILKNIKSVGNDFEITPDAGFCAKNHKEWVRVSSGGPHLKIEKVNLS